VVAMVGAILLSRYAFLALMLVFGFMCLIELQRLLKLKSYFSYLLLIGLFYFFGYRETNEYLILILLYASLLVKLILIRDLLVIRKIRLFESKKYALAIFYLIASVCFMGLISNYDGKYSPELLLGIFALIWINDTFAYLIGKNFGRHKLFQRISPNKTWEGFIGGVVFSCIGGYLIYIFTETLTVDLWIWTALITSVFGTFGDLIQSKLKRQADVKDSGTLLPGHGGLFDRLDSILFASTFIYGFLMIYEAYVP
jgi:phosphatidate cytidylyltransferase